LFSRRALETDEELIAHSPQPIARLGIRNTMPQPGLTRRRLVRDARAAGGVPGDDRGRARRKRVSELEPHERDAGDEGRRCPSCGKPVATGDRYCGECGAPLAGRESEDGGRRTEGALPSLASDSRPPTPDARPDEGRLWVFAAKPTAVIGGGVLLLLLAAALLWIGQRDKTGTIVMLAICLTPLALLTMAIGLARGLSRGVTRMGRSR
jgi:hypothetical protein